MNWYQEAMIAQRRRETSKPTAIIDRLEVAVAWLFLAGWAFAIAAEVMR